MGKGLKQMVAEALATESKPAPVKVSPEAHMALAYKMRQWSGWPNAGLILGPTKYSKFAECDHNSRVFTANIDSLSLNPNRVLLTVTPFRLRQEAVLTGALLHEAAHARFTHWRPRNIEQRAEWKHPDGEPVNKATEKLAMLCEEARIEGLMASQADMIGASGLDWTLRASAAHLLPMTRLSADEAQKNMDIITSWVLRAGREYALAMHTSHRVRGWVYRFSDLLESALDKHLDNVYPGNDVIDVTGGDIKALLLEMVEAGHEASRGTFMVDKAREVLELLFPETDEDEMPEVGGGCSMSAPSEQGDPEPDEGEQESGDGAASDMSDESDETDDTDDTDEADSEGDEGDSADDADDTDDDLDEQLADMEAEADGKPDEDETESETDEPDEDDSEGEVDTESELAQELADVEESALSQVEQESEEIAEELQESGFGKGSASGQLSRGDWRTPDKEERETAKRAETFLRNLISPSESSKVTLTDAPSSMVDGAAMAAWKAGGQSRDPRFFRHTQRTVEPSPPIKIAVLVDVSMSMEELQVPSSVLSWALASAALDLRNFAGRGQQIQSCLIHWGDEARVIQKNGELLPGIKTFRCNEGTSAMDKAFDLVEEQIPGFFDPSPDGHPENRLLVQFTDWELSWYCHRMVEHGLTRALGAGVNMVTIAPKHYRQESDLSRFLAKITEQRGRSTVFKYNPAHPDQVWDEAAKALG